jgi:hypothetical protein
VGGTARLRFAALRAAVEFFDHAAKSAIEGRYVVGMRLFSNLISVMIHRDAAVGANGWIGFSHFNNFNEAERSSGRIAATPNPHLILGELVNPSRIMPDRGQEDLPPAETINTFETIYFPAQRKHLARDNPRDAAGYRSSPRARAYRVRGNQAIHISKQSFRPFISFWRCRGENRQNPPCEVLGNHR